jgi:hypothetical protein
MGRERDSRGTTQIDRIGCSKLTILFVPTVIGFPYNAGIAVQTNRRSFT